MAADSLDPISREAFELGMRRLDRQVPGMSGLPALRRLAEEGLRRILADLEARDPARRLDSDLEARQRATEELSGAACRTLRAEGGLAEIFGLAREAQSLYEQRTRVQAARRSRMRRELPRELGPFGGLLARRAEEWSAAEAKLKNYLGISPRSWDLDPGLWQRIKWGGLDEAAACLAAWPELAQLARLIGRAPARPPEPEAVAAGAAPKREAQAAHWVEALGRSEINGYTRGSQLALLPAFETALLADPATEGLFLKAHAEGTLTTIEYLTEAEHWAPEPRDEAQELASPEPGQGPVIICLDTSGSMAGLPEQVAKALSLALVRSCHEQGRGCWLIGFSTEIRSLDLSEPLRALEGLADFLAHSFRGGTDLRPALAESLRVLDNPAWRHADLLIISDFRVPKLMIKKAPQIEPIRKRHQARLHALSVANAVPVDDLHIFDSRWHFRIGSSGAPLGIGGSQFREQSSLFSLEQEGERAEF